MLVDLGRSVPDGIGQAKEHRRLLDLCQHMGCPVEYKPALREFVCPCHQSRYDAERLGGDHPGRRHAAAAAGSACRCATGAIWAIGVDGLIYGYRNNLHPGKRVGGTK